jgi:hypothetical protein
MPDRPRRAILKAPGAANLVGGRTMEPTPTIARHEAINPDEPLVHDWRVMQLTRLGIPGLLAEGAAGHVDWHDIARLVQRGCPPLLALRIVR